MSSRKKQKPKVFKLGLRISFYVAFIVGLCSLVFSWIYETSERGFSVWIIVGLTVLVFLNIRVQKATNIGANCQEYRS